MASPTGNLTYARSDDKFSITVTDLTGIFSTSNTGGYGGPNAAVGDFSTFNITVTLPDPSTLLPGSTSVTVDAFPSLPSAASGTFTLTSLALLGTADTTLVDGVYLFEVSAVYDDGGEGEMTVSTYKAYYEIVGCCIKNMIVDSIGCGCSGATKKVQTLTKAWMDLSMLKPYITENEEVLASPIEQCNQWDKAATLILELQDICDNENCGGCNGCR